MTTVAGTQSEAVQSTPDGPATGFTLNVEALAWACVLVIAAAVRLFHLGNPAPDTIEALRARAAWDFANGGEFVAWPGDLTTALAALLIRLGDDTLDWVRLPNAVFGALTVASLWLLRPYLGRAVALVGGLILAISPLAVASSRTLNPDAAGLLCGLVIVIVVLRIGEDGDDRALPLLAAVLGLSLGVGGVAVAVAMIAAVHVIIEVFWLERTETTARWRAALADRRGLFASGLLFLAGALLAIVRFGAGPERLSLAGFTDWTLPSGVVGVLPGYAPLTVPLGYEPAVLGLGLASAGVLLVRWARSAGNVSVGERLLVEWAIAGLLLCVAVLHQRPGQLLVFALPLSLLAAHATVSALPTLAAMRWRESVPVLAVILVLCGYVALRLLEWTQKPDLPDTRAMLGVVGMLTVAAGLLAWVLFFSPDATPGVLAAGAWVLAGWIGLHAVAEISGRRGDEYLFGRRPEPLRAVLVREADIVLARGETVAVEQGIAAAMAWELRGRDVRVFAGMPPRSGMALAPVTSSRVPGFDPTGIDIEVERRWYPSGWEQEGIVRWLARRTAYGPSDSLRATTMISTSAETEPSGGGP
jgi:4-amino-4-deoxy-L-arabinose transferase-like glycosyltransferase